MISTTQALTQATLTGPGQTIPINWPFLAPTDLTVVKTRLGVDTPLILNTDYVVTGGGIIPTTGNVVMNAGVNGDIITVFRSIPLNQLLQLTTLASLPAKTLETEYDRIVMQLQQQQIQMDRSLRVPNSNIAMPEMTLNARKNNVIGFDSAGNLTFYAFVAGAVLPQAITGTVNQISANGILGPVSGSVTLSLPQDIAPGSQVQFGKVGIGQAPTNSSDLVISRSLPALNASACVVVNGFLQAPPGVDLHPDAYRDSTFYQSTVPADAYASYDSLCTLLGAQPYNHLIGFQARNGFNGTGILSRLEGFSGFMRVGSGNVTEARCFYVPDLSVSGGSVDHFAGLFIDQLTQGTIRHAIYAAGNDPWFSAGGQIFTSQDLTPPAGTPTCRMGCTFDQSTQTGMAVMNRNATATGVMMSFCRDGGSVQGSITQTNNTTIAYNTSSDSRLKENVRPFLDSGALVDAIQPVIFDWIWGGKDFHGFIAQDLYPVYAEAVTPGGDDINVLPWQIDKTQLIPVLMAEVKSLRARIATLESAPLGTHL